MTPPNHRPTEMYLGTSDQRRDLLRQAARGRARIATLAAVVFLVFLGLAAVVVGPVRAIDWVGTYLVPVAAILTVGFCVLLLLVGLTKRLPGGHDLSDWWQ